MRVLELKVPPPAIMLVIALLMWLVSRTAPAFGFALPAYNFFAILLFAVGFGTSASGVVTFRRAKTTLNPTKPEFSSSLVNWGVYTITRNPMYLGGLLMLTGCAVFLSNALAFLFLPLYVLYIRHFQIAPEERALTALFGQDYVTYQSRVRRWI